jgi:hypothetical protein
VRMHLFESYPINNNDDGYSNHDTYWVTTALYWAKGRPNYASGRLEKQAEMMNACASSCNHGLNRMV